MWQTITNISVSDWITLASALLGAVVGAIVGGVVSYRIVSLSTKEARKASTEARREEEYAVALRLLLKLQKIISSIKSLYFITETTISNTASDENNEEIWAKLQPIVAFDDVLVELDPVELVLFFRMRDYDYLQRIILLHESYKQLERGFKEYSKRRQDLTLEISSKNVGSVGEGRFSSDVSLADAPRITMLIFELERFIIKLRVSAKDQYNDGIAFGNAYGPKFRAHFYDPAFPVLQLTKSERIE
jgi:gas vesicle protein